MKCSTIPRLLHIAVATHPYPTNPSASRFDGLHAFDPATMRWTLLSAVLDAPRPSARYGHGFTSAGGKLFVHGGYGIGGTYNLNPFYSLI